MVHRASYNVFDWNFKIEKLQLKIVNMFKEHLCCLLFLLSLVAHMIHIHIEFLFTNYKEQIKRCDGLPTENVETIFFVVFIVKSVTYHFLLFYY